MAICPYALYDNRRNYITPKPTDLNRNYQFFPSPSWEGLGVGSLLSTASFLEMSIRHRRKNQKSNQLSHRNYQFFSPTLQGRIAIHSYFLLPLYLSIMLRFHLQPQDLYHVRQHRYCQGKEEGRGKREEGRSEEERRLDLSRTEDLKAQKNLNFGVAHYGMILQKNGLDFD